MKSSEAQINIREAVSETIAAFPYGLDRPVGLGADPSDYLALMKPRVMSLVVFTAFVGLVLAPGEIPLLSAMAAIISIAVGAGASGALNMWYDADIDAQMSRTRRRPIPNGRVSRDTALTFGIIMAGFAVWTLATATNWVAASLLAMTIAYYLFVYTMGLKRRTAQNIVIGGAAGAFPPVIGWAAVTGDAPMAAWVLFLIIFLWTPPHFWSLALYKKGDYEKVGIPMMPNVKGAASTRLQIFLYAILLFAISLVPAFLNLAGPVYLGIASLLGVGFLALSFKVWQSRAGEEASLEDEASLYAVRAGDRNARNLFAYSIVYLFVLFGALAIDNMLALGVS